MPELLALYFVRRLKTTADVPISEKRKINFDQSRKGNFICSFQISLQQVSIINKHCFFFRVNKWSYDKSAQEVTWATAIKNIKGWRPVCKGNANPPICVWFSLSFFCYQSVIYIPFLTCISLTTFQALIKSSDLEKVLIFNAKPEFQSMIGILQFVYLAMEHKFLQQSLLSRVTCSCVRFVYLFILNIF